MNGKTPKLNLKPVIVAASVASVLMLVSGSGFRVLATRLAAPVGANPIRTEALQQLPLQIGGWTGQDVPLDEAIIEATDTDALINRRYSRRGSLESVSLYIASGVRARDLMPHRPEVCYTGAGWTLTDRRFMTLPLTNEMELPCNVLQFSRGSFNSAKVVVLNYYLVDGQNCRDVSLVRSKAWRGSGTVNYVAQVQITTPIMATQTAHFARKVISDFAAESASLIADVFKQIEGIDHLSNNKLSDSNDLPKGL